MSTVNRYTDVLTPWERKAHTLIAAMSAEAYRAARRAKPKAKRVSYSIPPDCGEEIAVNASPAPNDIDISGRAVALNCRGRPKKRR